MPYNTPSASRWVERRVALCQGASCATRGPHVHLPTYSLQSVSGDEAVIRAPPDFFTRSACDDALLCWAYHCGCPGGPQGCAHAASCCAEDEDEHAHAYPEVRA